MIFRPYLVIKNGSRGPSYRVTKQPTSLDFDEIAIRLEIDLPSGIFSKPTLQANIKVEGDKVSAPIITADTVHNIEEVIKQNTGIHIKLTQQTEE